jgi:hypothetical protein
MTVALIPSSMRDESWKRSRLVWGTYLRKMPEKYFFTLFRMDYRTFQHVLERTKHVMQRDYLQSERTGGFVSPEAQLSFIRVVYYESSKRELRMDKTYRSGVCVLLNN